MRVFRFPRTGPFGIALYLDRQIKFGIEVNVTCGWWDISVPFVSLGITW